MLSGGTARWADSAKGQSGSERRREWVLLARWAKSRTELGAVAMENARAGHSIKRHSDELEPDSTSLCFNLRFLSGP